MAGQSAGGGFRLASPLCCVLAAGPSRGEEARLAISGYDPVAYFTDGKPVPGQSEFEYTMAQCPVAVREPRASRRVRQQPRSLCAAI